MNANYPIRTGIIGFGLAGQVFHSPLISADPAFSIRAVATANPARRAIAVERGYPVVDSPAELLARASTLDLVVLASPAHVHLEQGIAALEAGAAVVVDKPFASSVAEAEELIATAERVGRPLFVFQNRRWDGDFLTVRSLVESGRLGEIFRFESTFERFAGPSRNRWQDTTTIAQGAGITYDLGSHLVDQALQLFGPATLTHAETRVLRPGGVSDDDAQLTLVHENGVTSHLTVSRIAAQAGPRFRVLGTRSAYTVYGLDGQEAFIKDGGSPAGTGFGVTNSTDWGIVGGGTDDPLTRVPTEHGAYLQFYAGVAATLRDGAPLPVDPRSALETLRILERAHAIS